MFGRVAPRLAPLARSRACSGVPVLWHNPDCSKSRAALALLENRGEPFSVRAYLDEPPSMDELAALRQQLGPPIEWCRTSDDAWLK